MDGGPDAVRDYRKLLGTLEQFLWDDRTSIPPLFARVSSTSSGGSGEEGGGIGR